MERLITKKFLEWKQKSNRKPLIVRGARQVGKTHIILDFIKNHFEDYIYINLDQKEQKVLFFNVDSIHDFFNKIQVLFRKSVSANTVIFIDEIQNSPDLINLLRFFYEDYKDYYVIGAGSLLEAKIKKEGLNMPVGRIEYLFMYPMNFAEYLMAQKQNTLMNLLESYHPKTDLSDYHDILTKYFNEYMLIGGMPEVVASYIASPDLDMINKILRTLLLVYKEDVYKYSDLARAENITNLIDSIPLYTGKSVTYQEISNDIQISSNNIHKTIKLLEDIMILKIVYSTKSGNVPITPKVKRPKKIIFVDTGFVNFNLDPYINYSTDGAYKGRIMEQVVGQLLVSNENDYVPDIYFWAKNKAEGNAELDFTFSYKGCIVGIEVKSGSYGRLKSLYSFADNVTKPLLVRIYSGRLAYEEHTYNQKTYKVLSLPGYLVHRLNDFLDYMISN